MLFATFDYFLFLPIVAVVHWLFGSPFARTGWLLAVSLLFYAAWNPADTGLLLAIVGLSYDFGLALPRLFERGRGPLLGLAALCLLGPMVFFKYTHWVMDTVSVFLDVPVPARHHLPIGISFYSFQALAYVSLTSSPLPAASRGSDWLGRFSWVKASAGPKTRTSRVGTTTPASRDAAASRLVPSRAARYFPRSACIITMIGEQQLAS